MKIGRANPNGAYGTHIHPLVKAVLATTGCVVELGTGDFSTPILHELCRLQDRLLTSFDNNAQWSSNFDDLLSDTHQMYFVENWDAVDVFDCSVVLIDHAPANRRIVDIERYANAAEILVVHDTDKMGYYGYGPVFNTFEYKSTYKRFMKSTTLLSNRLDVEKILNG